MGTSGRHAVQITRTVPCRMNGWLGQAVRFPFAPKGDYTILEGLLKAIGTARNYIYIEDQYGLVVHAIQDAIHRALDRGLAHLVVLLAPALNQDNGSTLWKIGCSTSQYEMWSPFLELFPGRVTILQRTDGRLVHSKVWLMDDVYFNTGSANIIDRSYFEDQELNIAVVDEELVDGPDNFAVGKFNLETRARMWAEMSGKPQNYYMTATLADAVATLSTNMPSGSRVRGLSMAELKADAKKGQKTCGIASGSSADEACPYESSFDDRAAAWGPWGPWGTTCSKKCGSGVVTRSRSCSSGQGTYVGKGCIGIAVQKKACDNGACTLIWTEWQWSYGCPSGTRVTKTKWGRWGKRRYLCKQNA